MFSTGTEGCVGGRIKGAYHILFPFQVLDEAAAAIQVGVTTDEIDRYE